jgi:hypothetical protein
MAFHSWLTNDSKNGFILPSSYLCPFDRSHVTEGPTVVPIGEVPTLSPSLLPVSNIDKEQILLRDDQNASSSKRSLSNGAIIGITLGGVAVLAAAGYMVTTGPGVGWTSV